MPELTRFVQSFHLSPRWAAELFGRSPRTVRRWRQRRHWPRYVDTIMETVETGQPPITASLHRGPREGCYTEEWRARLFGADWRQRAAEAARLECVALARHYAEIDARRRELARSSPRRRRRRRETDA